MFKHALFLVIVAGIGCARANILTPSLFAHAQALAESFSSPCPPCESVDSVGDVSFTTGQRNATARADFTGADASASANASFGVLHASGTAAASTDAPASDGDGGGESGWVDIFDVVSNTLASGTPVDLRFTAVLEGTLSSGPSNGKGESSTASGVFQLWIGGVLTSFGCGEAITPCFTPEVLSASAVSMNDKFSGVKLPSTNQFVFTTSVGARFFTEGVLGAGGSAAADGTATANFSDTGFVTVESLTPGASFTTASGTTYSPTATVPEPSSGSMQGIEMFAVMLALLVRRQFRLTRCAR